MSSRCCLATPVIVLVLCFSGIANTESAIESPTNVSHSTDSASGAKDSTIREALTYTGDQNTINKSSYCPSYPDASVYRARKYTLTLSANLDDWEEQIQNAQSGTEILLEDGEYVLYKAEYSDVNTVFLDKPDVTVRSKSGKASAVVIRGDGYPGKRSDTGISIAADGIIIADLSIHQMQDHAIALLPALSDDELSGTVIYNVHLYDIGTQHIKGNAGGISQGTEIACSSIGYSRGAAVGDYNGGIDIHSGADVLVRDNYLYNITGDGSGCSAATREADCNYISSPAVYMNGSVDSIVERNTIVDSFRGISLGLVNGHTRGIVRNNIVHRDETGDIGISIQGSTNSIVEYNTVLVKTNFTGDEQGPIEVRGGSGHIIRNNLSNGPIWLRDMPSDIVLEGNISTVQ